MSGRFLIPAAAILAALATGAQSRPSQQLVCDITRFGAVANDGQSDDPGLARAIRACRDYHGKVVVPAGIFHSGGVQLASAMEFHLAEGAVLRGMPRLEDYPVLPTGEHGRSRGLVSAIGVRDLVISGTGILDGAGTPFHAQGDNRPEFSLGLFDCSNVRVSGITLIDPAKYHVTTNRCTDVAYDRVTIRAGMLAPNSDGIQVRDSSDVSITNCVIETGDDAIVLKSSARWVERVRISNCVLTSDDAAFKLGTGSEPGIRDVTVDNTVITASRYGIALFMQDGGVYENLRFSNMVIETGGRHAREYPVFVDIDTRQPDDPAGWGRIRNVHFDSLAIVSRGNILIQGQPGHDVEDISLSNIVFRATNAVDLTRVFGKPRGNRAHAPRTGASDHSNLSGHIVIGHATGVRLSGIDAAGTTPADRRPVLVTTDVRGLSSTQDDLGTSAR